MAQRQFRSDDTTNWSYKMGNGSDGALTISSNTTFSANNESCSGTGGATTLTTSSTGFADGDLVLIHQSRGTGVGQWELSKVASGGGTSTLTLDENLIYTYTDSGSSQAQVVKLFQYSSVTVNSGINWTAPEWDGNVGGIVAYLCNGDSTITGNIVSDSKGFRGGIQTTAYPSHGDQGEGTVGDRGAHTTATNGNGAGGGQGIGGSANGGGGGGNGAAGSNGGAAGETPGTGGLAVGTASLVTMDFGGGAGAGGSAGSPNQGGAGGDGGGIVVIISKTLTVTGTITNDGQAGSNASGGVLDGAGGGGGAGGSVLMKCETATLGTTLIAALLGAKGISTGPGANGGDGAVGRIHLDYSKTVSGTTSPALDSTLDTTITSGVETFRMFLVM